MRFLMGLLVVVALGYAAYSAILTAGTYLEVSQVVDDAMIDLKPGLIENVQHALGGGDRSSPASKLRDMILEKATKAHLPISAESVTVRDDEQRIHVQVKWTQPVVTYQNSVVFALPLTLRRTFDPGRAG